MPRAASVRLWAPSQMSAPLPANSAAAPVTIPEKSIAVLPFVDMSEKKDQEYFSDGLSEELLDMQYAMVNAWCGDNDAAFHWLERANQVHDGGLIYLAHERFIAKLRGDPRHEALLKKLGLPLTM